MTELTQTASSEALKVAYLQGRRVGLATSALILSVFSFLNLIGMEKSLLAIVLAVLAMRGTAPALAAVRRGRIALGLSALHIVTIIVILVVFRDRLAEVLDLLR